MIPERIRNLVRDGRQTREEREVLEEWLEDCGEDEFDEYLRLRGDEEGRDDEE